MMLHAGVVVVVVGTWRLGPLEKGFPSKRWHAARVGSNNRERFLSLAAMSDLRSGV